MKHIILCLLLSLWGVKDALAWDHTYTDYDRFLKKEVRDGKINYAGIKKDPHELEAFIQKVERLTEDELKGFPSSQAIAFWINVYNAFTVKLILEHYPVKSIRDIESPWKRKFIKTAGRTLSLDEIENEILRSKFNEPRIHFALVCAAQSCPELRPFAYRADQLEKQLEESGSLFIRDTTRNKVIPDHENRIFLSQVFEWYGQDFRKSGKTLLDYLQKLGKIQFERSPQIGYLSYSWELNERK